MSETKAPPLVEFRSLCQLLLDQGIKPTPGILAEYGYAYPTGHNGNRRSGPCLKSGRYSAARREVFLANGWTRDGEGSMAMHEGGAKWTPPSGWVPKEERG